MTIEATIKKIKEVSAASENDYFNFKDGALEILDVAVVNDDWREEAKHLVNYPDIDDPEWVVDQMVVLDRPEQ